MQKTLFIFLSIVALVSCNNHTSKNTRASIYSEYIDSHQLVGTNNIRTFKFQDWSSLDDKHLIISSSHNNFYLVTLDFYCNDLQHTSNILLDQSISSTLSAKFDSIIVPNNIQLKCRIKSFHKITKDQKNELTALRKNSL